MEKRRATEGFNPFVTRRGNAFALMGRVSCAQRLVFTFPNRR